MSSTRVVNIHKIKGKRPAYDIYIGRATWNTEFIIDSIWANPFYFGQFQTGQDCLDAYEYYIRQKIARDPIYYDLEPLRGKVLGCWCKPGLCHGDVLLKLLREKLEINLHSLVGTTDEMPMERKNI